MLGDQGCLSFWTMHTVTSWWAQGPRINNERNGYKDAERMVIRYLGEEIAGKMLPDPLKVKHVAIEVSPEKVLLCNV
ncbi:MAG: hypothetical protein ACREBS_06580 [Nitrososphaerales archaeon]